MPCAAVVIGSAALHVAVIGAAHVRLAAHASMCPSEPPPVVPVDLVTIADKTNIAPTVTEEQQARSRNRSRRRTPAPEPEPQPPSPKMRPNLRRPNCNPTPQPRTRRQRRRRRPQPTQKPQPDQTQHKFNVDNVLALLNKLAPKSHAPANAKLADRTVRGIGARTR